jgi:hypothetical protein
MKKQYFLFTVAFALISICSFAETKTDTIRVYGNCEMCKEHIENAAKEAGVSTADWNEKTKLLVVSYDDVKTTNLKIQQKIAAVGYDTQDVKASEKSYKKLDKCCQYERKKEGHSSITPSTNLSGGKVAWHKLKEEKPSFGKGYHYIGNNAQKQQQGIKSKAVRQVAASN